MPAKLSQNHEITLSFSADEIAQIEAFATLHGVSVGQWMHGAVLSQAQITPKARPATGFGAGWLSESSAASGEARTDDLFALDAPESLQNPRKSVDSPPPNPETQTPISNSNRGTAGIASTLARGSGPVWEIRQALARERVHGLGWTREQLAFVLKMSVVGVRKMEHLGKTPNKSLEARRNLLALAQTLQSPTPDIAAFIERETIQLAALH